MPTYDYICNSCGNAWELEQRIVEDAVKECPKCGRSTAKRQISAGAGFILKGGGWYADLYSSKPSKPSGDDSKPDDKGGKTEKKSDETTSKPDAGKSDGKEGGGGSGSTPDKGSTPSGKGDVKAA